MATTRPTGKIKKPKENTAAIIEQMASEGYSQRNIAKALGIGADLYRVWLENYPELAEAQQLGKDKEHKELHNALYTAATKEGNVTAAIFLLKTRHGYREGDQSDTANKVSITFNLPAAQNADDYMKTIGSNRTLLGGE